MSESRQARHAKHRKKFDVQRYQKILESLFEKIKLKTEILAGELSETKHARHRKKIDKEKVEKTAEKVIIKTAILFAVIFIPLFIILFIFFEFGGYLKDAIEFIAGIIHNIVRFCQFIFSVIGKIIQFIQGFIAAFKKPS